MFICQDKELKRVSYISRAYVPVISIKELNSREAELSCNNLSKRKAVGGLQFDRIEVSVFEDIDKNSLLTNYNYIKFEDEIYDITCGSNITRLTVGEYFGQSLCKNYPSNDPSHCSTSYVDLVYCPRCKKYEPMWFQNSVTMENESGKVMRSDYLGYSSLSSLNFKLIHDLYKSSLAPKSKIESIFCSKCKTRLPKDNLIIKACSNTADPLPIDTQFFIESANSGHQSVRCVFYRRVYSNHGGSCRETDTVQDRLSIDLETGNIYYIEPLLKSKWHSNRAFRNITLKDNYLIQRGDLPKNLASWVDYRISTKSFFKIARKIYNFHKENLDVNIPYRYYFSGVDNKVEEQSILELMRIAQFPKLTLKCYRYLRRVYWYLMPSSIHNKDKAYKEIAGQNSFLLKNIKQLLKNRFTVTDKDVYKALGVSSKILKGTNGSYVLSAVVKTIFKSLQDSTKKIIEWTLKYFENKGTSEQLKSVFQVFYLLYLPKKGTNFRYIFQRYCRELAGADSALIEQYIVNMLNKSTPYKVMESLTQIRDGFNALDIAYDQIGAEGDLGEYIPFKKCIKMNKLPPCIIKFLKDVLCLSSATKFHDNCMKYASRLVVGDVPIDYSKSFLDSIKQHNQFTLLKDGEVNEFEIVPAKTTKELKLCTDNMYICTVTYWRKALDKETNILFLLNKTYKGNLKRYFEGCIEVTNSKSIIQIKGRENKSIMPELKPFVEDWIKANPKLVLETNDLKLSDESFISEVEDSNPYEQYIENVLRRIAQQN